MKKIFFATLLLFSFAFFVTGVSADTEVFGECKCVQNGTTFPFPDITEVACNNLEKDFIEGDPEADCTFTPPASSDPVLPDVPIVKVTAPGALPTGGTTGGVAGAAKAGADFAKSSSTVKLGNPLGSTDIRIILGKIVSAGMGILGSVTLLVFVYGGFLWLTSAGSAEKVKKGSQTMMWAVVGLFLIFGSYAILGLVLEGIGAVGTK